MADISTLIYIDATGYHYPDYPTMLLWLQDQYKNIYGADVYIESDSQDGQLLAVFAKALYDTAAGGSADYSSFSPLSAQGVGLSRLVKINGIARINPTFSTVDLDIGGTVGTTITGGIAEDTLGQKWDLPSPTLITSGGTVTVTATSQLVGAIQAQPSTVNRIFTPTRGWQTVNNISAASAGQPVESDAELRQRQSVSTAIPSLTVLEGTLGAVSNVEGVTDVRAYENDTGSTDMNGIPAHKFSIVASGGDSTEIAETIALHKTPGTGTYGTTSVPVLDAHSMPLVINFFRPTLVTIKVEITGSANDTWSTNYEELIQQAVADSINAIGIGNDVLITRLFSPAYLNGAVQGTSYDIVTLQIGKNMDPLGDVNIDIDFNELAFCDPATDVTVIIS